MFSLADFKLAKTQIVRLHVLLVHDDGTMGDVTDRAMYISGDEAIAMAGGAGQITGGMQAGTATITASLGAATPAAVKATVMNAMCHPVINELTAGSATSGTDEWVEIYNPCKDPVDVSTWTLVYRGANTVGPTDTSTLMPLMGQMISGELRLYVGSGFTGGANDGQWGSGIGLGATDGAVALRAGAKDTGPIVDKVAYGSVAPTNPFIETSALPAMVGGKSAARRLFDGNDSDDNATDFAIVSTETPRALNIP